MRRRPLLASLFLFVALPASAQERVAQAPTAVLSWSDGQATVRYELPAGADRVVFANDGESAHANVRSHSWTLDSACFALDRRGIRILDAKCGTPSARLDTDEKERDRTYPGLVRLQNGGALVFTSYLLAKDSTHTVGRIVARAPAGGIVEFRGRKSKDLLELFPSEFIGDSRAPEFGTDIRGWIYLGPDRFHEAPAVEVLVDDGVNESLRAALLQMAPALVEIYSDRLGKGFPNKPTLHLNWIARERAIRNFQADVVPGGVIRLSLSGQGWGAPDAAAMASFQATTAHELAHLWNATVFRSAPSAASWLPEGGAELLSLSALLSAGLVDGPAAGKRIADALDDCVVRAGMRAWVSIHERQSGRIPYTCGLALHFGIAAAAHRHDPAVDAFGLWRAIWREDPLYFEASPARYFQRSGRASLVALLTRIFTDKEYPLVEGLRELYREGGLGSEEGADIPPSMKSAAAGSVLAGIMGSACKGSFGFRSLAGHFMVDQMPSNGCEPFQQGMKLGPTAGVDPWKDPIAAAAAVRAACAADAVVRIQLLEGGEITVPCKEPLELARMPGPWFAARLEAERVSAVLAGTTR